MLNPSPLLVSIAAALLLGGCVAVQTGQGGVSVAAAPETSEASPFTSTPYRGAKASAPIPASLRKAMTEKGMAKSAPILVRIFKQEKQLEVWKQTREGRYEILKTYPICNFSGGLGPKLKEGDKQSPEGFYAVGWSQMNPNSAYYLSFDVGFPNRFDRGLGRTGTALMVHGGCLSAGCYAMGDDQIREVYALARDALSGGQGAFQVQAYPFRMTDENMRRHARDPNIGFWSNLKVGNDAFEATRNEVSVGVRNRSYAFNMPRPKVDTPMFAEAPAAPTEVAVVAKPRRF